MERCFTTPRNRSIHLLIGLAALSLLAPSLLCSQQTEAPPVDLVSPGTVGPVYKLQPFDLVQVSVYGEEDLASEQRISDNGTVSMPLLGEVEIGGLKVNSAAKKIEQAFIDGEYIRRPVVTISIAEFSPKTVTVLGQVEEPGSVTIPPGKNGLPLQVAIAGAGGFTGTAKITEVHVTRGGAERNGDGSGDESNFIVVNVDKILESVGEADGADPVVVYPDDIVFVPRRVF